MYALWIAVGLLIVALIAAVARNFRTKQDVIKPQEPMVKIPDEFHGISHITRGDVRLDIERKSKQMKSRSRNKQ